MQENFTISIRNGRNLNFLKKIVISFLITAAIIYPTVGFNSLTSILTFIILYGIVYILVTSMTNENLSNELPSTLYPSSPHTGLDGISLNNYVAGMDVNKYI
jgi:hypothetical protein